MGELTLGPVHHIRLSVNDLERSRAFYTEVLGLQVAIDGPPPPWPCSPSATPTGSSWS